MAFKYLSRKEKGRPNLRFAELTVSTLSIPLLFAAASGIANAQSTLSPLPMGQSMTFGGASHPRTVQNAFHNPASLSASDRRGIWTGFGAVGFGYEIGEFNNLEERIDSVEADLERQDITTFQEAEEVKANLEELLADISRDGTIRLDAGLQPPLMPLGAGLPGIGGQFSIGLSAIVTAKVSILDGPIDITPNFVSGNFELDTTSSAYVKGGAGGILSLGYSGIAAHRDDGELQVGGRINYYTMELGKAVERLDNGDEEDGLEDDFEDNTNRDSAIGLDLGVLWTARNYRVGGTLRNVNEPSLEYPSIGLDCDTLSSGTASANCFAAASFSDRIDLAETHTMERQLQLEGAIFTTGRNWSLSGSYDVSANRNLVGEEQQWANVTGAFSGRGWWVPGLRLGYRSNQVGSELDYITAGLTLFRIINVDAAIATDSVDYDGDEVPRAGMFSVSLELFY